MIRYSKEHMKKLHKSTVKYTPEVLSFVRECAEKGKSRDDTVKLAEQKFQIVINKGSLIQSCYHQKKKIIFHTTYQKNKEEFRGIDLFRDEEFKKFVRYANQKSIYSLRDMIIEEFDVNIKMNYLREYCSRHGILKSEKKIVEKKILNSHKIHFLIDESYLCNRACCIIMEKCTIIPEKVTCRNCLREIEKGEHLK